MPPSKRNSSRAVFTSHERVVAASAWSPATARLTRDSFLPFGSCILCMEPARDPVCCTEGDLMCRECLLANVLAQKKEIKRIEKVREKAEKGRREGEALLEAARKEKERGKWERVQMGLDNDKIVNIEDDDDTGKSSDLFAGSNHLFIESGSSSTPLLLEGTSSSKRKATENSDTSTPPTKTAKTFTLTTPAPQTSFWSPSQTPSVSLSTAVLTANPAKSHPLCPGPGKNTGTHILTIKHITTLLFADRTGAPWDPKKETEKDRIERETRWYCPACIKELSNATGAVVAKCGHVCCKGCAEMVAEEELPSCLVCGESTKQLKNSEKSGRYPPGWLELRSEGTGFSAKGGNKVRKLVTAFNA